MTVLIAGALVFIGVGLVLVVALLRAAAVEPPPPPMYDPDNLHGWPQEPEVRRPRCLR